MGSFRRWYDVLNGNNKGEQILMCHKIKMVAKITPRRRTKFTAPSGYRRINGGYLQPNRGMESPRMVDVTTTNGLLVPPPIRRHTKYVTEASKAVTRQRESSGDESDTSSDDRR